MVTVVQPLDSMFVKMHNGRGRSALHIDFSFGKSSGGVKTDSAESAAVGIRVRKLSKLADEHAITRPIPHENLVRASRRPLGAARCVKR